jgi:hypothetical protein
VFLISLRRLLLRDFAGTDSRFFGGTEGSFPPLSSFGAFFKVLNENRKEIEK